MGKGNKKMEYRRREYQEYGIQENGIWQMEIQ